MMHASPLSRGPVPGVRLRCISLGAGVQSSTLALLAARGEIGPMPDAAIFADTGSEPVAVYEWLEWLEKELPFPVHRVSKGNLGDDLIRISALNSQGQAIRLDPPPFYTAGGEGIIRRQCTKGYKIEPIRTKVRELLGFKKGARAGKDPLAEQWIGISLDELQRVKESWEPYIVHRWPLIERRWTRRHCIDWMQANYGKVAPRSACVFCPYHDNEEWRNVRAVPEDWALAVRVDTAVRSGLRKMNDQMFAHRSGVPLEQADLSEPGDPSQISMLDECDGMCGV
jgi:hypothetical protein